MVGVTLRLRRIRAALLCAAVAALLVLTPSSAGANPWCVFYYVHAPIIGTHTGMPCSPDTPFTHPVGVTVCTWKTWPSVIVCVGPLVHTP